MGDENEGADEIEEGAEAAAEDEGGGEPEEGAEGSEPEEDTSAAGAGRSEKLVPLATLIKEREKNRQRQAEIERQAQADREFRVRMEERQRMAAEQEAAEKARQDEAAAEKARIAAEGGPLGDRPDPVHDPEGAMEWDERFRMREIKRAQNEATRAREIAEKTAKDAAASAEQQAFISGLTQDRLDFASRNPDYQDAMNFLKSSLMEYLTDPEEGLGLPANIAEARFSDQINQIVFAARQNQKSAAAALYGFAKRSGYKKAAGGARPDSAAERIETQARGSKLRTMGNASPAASPDATSLEEVDRMSPAEFREWYKSDKNKKAWRRMLGE